MVKLTDIYTYLRYFPEVWAGLDFKENCVVFMDYFKTDKYQQLAMPQLN